MISQRMDSVKPCLNTKALDHLGIITAVLDDLKLVDLIDSKMPVGPYSGARLTMGQRLAGMIINGLGFVNTKLYMTPDFFEKKTVEQLFGEGGLNSSMMIL